MFIDYAVSKDCINIYSYGMICVGCGCCSMNPDYRDMIIRRIRYCKERLNEEQNFNDWEENDRWRKRQEKVMKANILYYKRKIRLYKKVLKILKVRTNNKWD